MSVSLDLQPRKLPEPSAALELIKPITWFPPMWAYACGVVSSGASITEHWGPLVLGVLLAGPIVCGMSQAANDWCDRHVDAINEPNRPIPSGRVPGRWGLWIALMMSALALVVGLALGPWGFGATVLAVMAAWAYSVEPIRMKRSGWWGPGLVGLSYESLPWFTGAAVMVTGAPSWEIVIVAILYGLGAHGIMTLNDFKALEGDRQMGVNSLPVTLGPERAAKIACIVMLIPQLAVIGLLFAWGLSDRALVVLALVVLQLWAMREMMEDPKGRAPWYNGTGVLFYVSGMMVTAFALRGLGGV
ncbi:bacteriochlorophyll/chlorophyll synthetase [Dinoroseobacter shibae DFL 12 = DSM 16493]|jgi:chlorophyll synthase|uniref:Bacteriochlorophyll/chlorophyll synthetase n=1 Tax=Dinoroseobacter shibae (strain DSM 16493 / NCIMB 14021 / DFL 12) TaxID=398580 RepID=A8LQ23_DINSH|nr:chlorophyll synthase ChlG [Dinoroseobacter shibae]ABV95263.1 bacteriochlorophyll/chlorophyll synthetase [Dinoroseobacter shibae DFL 12 = DSM 16493]URF46670.1 chlorophyll synthase ChlG [Dinoroseobacter shibae]URF50976.1 chlorophyll synthase ChlG [Dinoroseobacter shibae]